MFTRRQFLQLTALSAFESSSATVHAINFDHWPINLKSLEPIAHSVFEKHKLVLSSQFQIEYDPWNKTANNQSNNRNFDINGVEYHIAENGARVPIVVRNIFTNKLILAVERYGDKAPSTLSVFRFSQLSVLEIKIWINFYGLTNDLRVLNRVWALTESNNIILCTYGNIKNVWASNCA